MIALLFWLQIVQAHVFDPPVLNLTETRTGQWSGRWQMPQGRVGEVPPVLVATGGCTADDAPIELSLRCDGPGAVQLLPASGASPEVVVHLWSGGESRTIVAQDGRVEMGPGVDNDFLDWVRLGVVHILGGWDHLLFLFGLLFCLRRARTHLLALTAFTVGHLGTLMPTSYGHSLSIAPVEVCIALSIAVMGAEILRGPQSLLTRRPYLISGLFGLLHGLGFAGTLTGLDVARDNRVSAVLGFNVGVELGQIVFALLAIGPVLWLRGRARSRVVCAYGLGVVGMAVAYQRVVMG